MSEAMNELAKLRDAIDRAAKELHLKRHGPLAAMPAELDTPDHVVVTFKIDPEVLVTAEEREKQATDNAFNDLVENMDGPKEDPQVISMREQAQKLLEDDDWNNL